MVIRDFRIIKRMIQDFIISYNPDMTPEKQYLFMEYVQQRLLTNEYYFDTISIEPYEGA